MDSGTELLERLASLVTSAAPLGPPASEEIDLEIGPYFYDGSTRAHRERLQRGSCVLVGRKGAGKTSLLFGGSRHASTPVALSEDEVYGYVTRVIKAIRDQQVVCSVDQVAEIWRATFNLASAVAVVARRETDNVDLLRFVTAVYGNVRPSFPGTGNAREAAALLSTGISRFLTGLLNQIAARDGLLDLREAIDSVSFGGARFGVVVSNLTKHARAFGRTQILVDSVEQLGDFFENYKAAIAGLMRLLSLRLGRDTPFEAVVCFPNEVDLSSISSNPIKDVVRQVEVSWSSHELIGLLGRRLHLGLSILDPSALKTLKLDAWSPTSELDSRDAVDLVRNVFPEYVMNAFGQDEPTVSYLLRHTQLLPRHAILLGNSVLSEQIDRHGNLFPVDATLLADAVDKSERFIASDILSAYSAQSKLVVSALSEIVPSLPLVFEYGKLHKMYNRSVARYEISLNSLLSAAETMGVVGRYSSETGSYIEADFAYTVAGRPLRLTPQDRVCLHPVFAKLFNCPQAVRPEDQGPNVKPVHPRGSGWRA